MYTKPVLVRKEISKDEAKTLLTETRVVRSTAGYNVELDVYQNCGGMLYRVFTLSIPNSFEEHSDSFLLEYARNHMPDEISF